MTRPLVVDTDGGTDDCTALWWLLSEPAIEVVGVIATWGNLTREAAAANVARVLTAVGREEIPLVLGAEGPLGPGPLGDVTRTVHGADGLGGTAGQWPTGTVEACEPAAAWLAGRARRHEGTLAVLTLGPLSSLAAALQADPGLARRVPSLTVMGGSVRAGGSVLPWAETNVALDPAAAAEVVAAPWSSPPVLVGLDATLGNRIPVVDIDAVASSDAPAARFLGPPLRTYADRYRRMGRASEGAIPCHDLTAAVTAAHPQSLVEAPVVPLAIDTGGSAAWGATVADLREVPENRPDGFHRWRVALTVEPEATALAFRRLVGLDGSAPAPGGGVTPRGSRR